MGHVEKSGRVEWAGEFIFLDLGALGWGRVWLGREVPADGSAFAVHHSGVKRGHETEEKSVIVGGTVHVIRITCN